MEALTAEAFRVPTNIALKQNWEKKRKGIRDGKSKRKLKLHTKTCSGLLIPLACEESPVITQNLCLNEYSVFEVTTCDQTPDRVFPTPKFRNESLVTAQTDLGL